MKDDLDDMAVAVVTALNRRGEWIAVAESLTGGLVAAALTAAPGASDVFAAGVVAYLPTMKTALLGVDADLIDQAGVVSTDVAQSMAAGVAENTGADWGIGTTGVAGPAAHGGRPPGDVIIGVRSPDGSLTSEICHFEGDRAEVRTATVRAALTLVMRRMAAVAN